MSRCERRTRPVFGEARQEGGRVHECTTATCLRQDTQIRGRKCELRYAAIVLSIVTILALNAILLLGTVVHDPQSIRLVLNGLVAVIDLSLVSSVNAAISLSPCRVGLSTRQQQVAG